MRIDEEEEELRGWSEKTGATDGLIQVTNIAINLCIMITMDTDEYKAQFYSGLIYRSKVNGGSKGAEIPGEGLTSA